MGISILEKLNIRKHHSQSNYECLLPVNIVHNRESSDVGDSNYANNYFFIVYSPILSNSLDVNIQKLRATNGKVHNPNADMHFV